MFRYGRWSCILFAETLAIPSSAWFKVSVWSWDFQAPNLPWGNPQKAMEVWFRWFSDMQFWVMFLRFSPAVDSVENLRAVPFLGRIKHRKFWWTKKSNNLQGSCQRVKNNCPRPSPFVRSMREAKRPKRQGLVVPFLKVTASLPLKMDILEDEISF